ncbi:hypothetical protein I3842_06G056500 [Carya illinoinensis]|uniref:Uncharacterized protein n=1 Tax=Carya illinoinensis TaxID=32201 RepID=A0A922JHU2_CARIL|nr:hypothetical protein I3842_06G056500 [Carya illinoinensis]
MNRQAMSFQSGAIKSTSQIFPVGNYFGMHNNGDLVFSGNYSGVINNNPVFSEAGNPSGSSLVLDSVPGLKHDTGLAVEWSVEEQRKLDEGLDKFADEPSIMKYIKIAATLRDKTVRDVALRCRWLMSKRRKPDEHSMGKKLNNRKDKLVELSSKTNIPAVLPNLVPNSLMMHHMDQNEISGTGGPMKHLLEQNVQAFDQITANLSKYKWQDNINIFSQARKNIVAILNNMRERPGIMCEMPPLPVCIDEDLANSIILYNTT